jgi:hypothetical protein
MQRYVTTASETRDLGSLEELSARTGMPVPEDLVGTGWRGKSRGDGMFWERLKPGSDSILERRWVMSPVRSAAEMMLELPPVVVPTDTPTRVAKTPPAPAVVRRVRLSSAVLARLEVANMRSTNLRSETAGICRGRLVGDTVVLDSAETACRNETRRAVDLVINKDVAKPIGDSVVRADYHFHPSGDTEPSDTDKESWRACWQWNQKRGVAGAWVSLVVGASTTGTVTVAAFATDGRGCREIPVTDAS